jgi:energy-coupling factor transport system permease protein
MLRDITIGQYFPIDSPVHRLDPRIKIIISFIYLISLFIVKDLLVFAFVTVFLLFIIKISKVPVKYILKIKADISHYNICIYNKFIYDTR